MTSESAAKKDIQKLQRAIVEGLEDVKGQDIVVFNTEELSPLFERVIVASGTSNRQTKALASSVRDAVREAGFDKPRVEGEENGEWIIVDCGQAVAHVMQPAIRQYYRLEEIWGAKPVRLTTAAAKKSAAAKKPKAAAEPAAEAKPQTAKAVARKAAAKKAAAPAKKAAPAKSAGRTTAAKPAAKPAAPAKTAAKTAAKKAAAPAKKAAPAKPRAPLSKVVVNAPAAKKKTGSKAAPATARKPAAKKKA